MLFICHEAFANIHQMTLEEKIGQLFIIPFSPQHDIEELVFEYHIGGVIFKGVDLKEQMYALQSLQKRSKIPLLCTVDAENGIAQRIPNLPAFPQNMTLGAIQDDTLLYKLGQEIGRQCKLIGAHVNFAPVIDVNSNPLNPIIHMRSFGDDPIRVAEKGEQIMRGMQDVGLVSVAKHFPGHGDVSIDSHYALPLTEIQEVALYPFRKLIERGVSGVMLAHLSIPKVSLHPTSLSSEIITDLLTNTMNFEGLIFSDALNMKALTLYYTPAEIAVLAFQSGTTCLLYGDHLHPNITEILHHTVPTAFKALKEAFLNGILSLEELDKRVEKILAIKHEISIDPETVYQQINTSSAYALKRELYRASLTLYADPHHLIPLHNPGQTIISIKKLDPELLAWISAQHRLIIVVFGSPYIVSKIKGDHTIIVAYEENEDTIKGVQDILSGELVPQGKLPITIHRENGLVPLESFLMKSRDKD